MNKNKNNMIVLAIVAIVAIAGISIFAMKDKDDNNMGRMMGNSSNSSVQADMNSADYKQYAALKVKITIVCF